jgi:hypothetical protein
MDEQNKNSLTKKIPDRLENATIEAIFKDVPANDVQVYITEGLVSFKGCAKVDGSSDVVAVDTRAYFHADRINYVLKVTLGKKSLRNIECTVFKRSDSNELTGDSDAKDFFDRNGWPLVHAEAIAEDEYKTVVISRLNNKYSSTPVIDVPVIEPITEVSSPDKELLKEKHKKTIENIIRQTPLRIVKQPDLGDDARVVESQAGELYVRFSRTKSVTMYDRGKTFTNEIFALYLHEGGPNSASYLSARAIKDGEQKIIGDDFAFKMYQEHASAIANSRLQHAMDLVKDYFRR